MTEGIVMLMCENKTPHEIAKTTKKAVLCQMYKCLFQMSPRRNSTSLDIAYAIWNYIQDAKRTADLCKILQYMQ